MTLRDSARGLLPRGSKRALREARRSTHRFAWLGWGTAAALAYLAAMAWAWPWTVPVRLLYDGYTPPAPYHWVHPPASLAANNERPSAGSGVVTSTPQGSGPASIATGDEQSVLVVPKGAFAIRQGQPPIAVRIEPIDPTTIAPTPGNGLAYDGNAYRITATYTDSHDAAPLIGPVNIVLRYATGATLILRAAGSTWVPLSPTTLPITFQIYGPTNDLGVFVAAGPPAHGLSLSAWTYQIVTVLLWLAVAALAGLLIRDAARRAPRGGKRAGR